MPLYELNKKNKIELDVQLENENCCLACDKDLLFVEKMNKTKHSE